jgi:lipoate synthase
MTIKRLLRNKCFLHACRAKRKDKINQCLQNASKDQIDTLSECALNIYKGNIPIGKRTVERLRPYKKHLKTLGLTQLSTEKKKRILQKGGFLPILGAIASALLTSLLTK